MIPLPPESEHVPMPSSLPAPDPGSHSNWLAHDVQTPALLLDLDILEANLHEMAGIARSNGVELLPHAKTHRMAQVGLLQVAQGADGLCVAKIGEAEQFTRAGIGRIFVAYPIVGRHKAERAIPLHRRIRLTLATDSVEGASTVGEVFAAHGETARVMLAVDSGLGREGVAFADASAVASAVAALPGIDLVGIYTHEGSVYGAENRKDLETRARRAAERMVELAERIRASGVPLAHVSMGASASARTAAAVSGVTQMRPGIYAFNDVGQIALGNASLESTAVRVIATVVSHPEPNRACIDAGSKALSTDLVPAAAHRDEYPGHGLIVNAPGWVIERMSEEHGWLRWIGDGEPGRLDVGAVLEIVPNHVCLAFAMLRRATVIRGKQPVDEWDGFGPGSSE
jgi:D-serine deaminase-like pyridoxal phosphate-dependent protein